MDPDLAQLILQDRKIVYAITDRHLNVIEVSGALGAFYRGHRSWLERSLLDLVPELVGSENALAEVLAGDPPRFQLPWINRETAEGQTIYLTVVSLPHRDQRGQIAGLLLLIQDTTETGRLEQRLAQHRNELRLLQDRLKQQNLELAAANAELRRLDELKSEFVSVAAHELRTPLSAVFGYVEMLLDEDAGPLTDRQREFLEVVGKSSQRLLEVTKDLLDLTRLEAGRLELALQPQDLPALVEAVAAEFEPQLAAKGQRLTLRAPPDLPPALCDEARAAQIVGNLLSNAVKYTPDGGQIAIRVTHDEKEGFLRVSVADNGVGIPPEDQPKLFSRFFRARSAARTRASGAGLGLHIARSLVELHGGRIWFESALDRGSTFYVTFPAADLPAFEG